MHFSVNYRELCQRLQGRTTEASSFSSDLTSLFWTVEVVLLASIPMMPFRGLAEGFEATWASPFMPGLLCSGSGAGARRFSLACCRFREDIGTALEQRIALYLQTAEDYFTFWKSETVFSPLFTYKMLLGYLMFQGIFVWFDFFFCCDFFFLFRFVCIEPFRNRPTCCSSSDCLSRHHSRRCRGGRCLSAELSGRCRHGHWLTSSFWIWHLRKNKTPEVKRVGNTCHAK